MRINVAALFLLSLVNVVGLVFPLWQLVHSFMQIVEAMLSAVFNPSFVQLTCINTGTASSILW